VSWDDFTVFETILKRPVRFCFYYLHGLTVVGRQDLILFYVTLQDAPYEIAFRWFDTDNNGLVTFDEFQEVFKATMSKESIPFNFDSPWVTLYLGKKDGVHVLDYAQFAQMMKGLPGERMRQAFHYFDKEKSGYIKPDEFAKIIKELARHKLSDPVLSRLTTLCTLSAGNKISYSEVIAFHNVSQKPSTLAWGVS